MFCATAMVTLIITEAVRETDSFVVTWRLSRRHALLQYEKIQMSRCFFVKFCWTEAHFFLAIGTLCFGLQMTLLFSHGGSIIACVLSSLAHNDPQSRLWLLGLGIKSRVSRLSGKNDTIAPVWPGQYSKLWIEVESSGGSRISHWGGCQPPTRLLFGDIVYENERIGSDGGRGARAGGVPWIRQCGPMIHGGVT